MASRIGYLHHGSFLRRAPMRAVCLVALCLFSSVTVSWAGDYTYAVSGGAVTLTGYSGAGGVLTLPAMIDGLPVTAIGRSAFQLNTSLTGVTIPEGVTVIGRSAFYGCSGLVSVSVPASVTSIERNAFQSCSSLAGVSFKGNAPVLGANVFFGAGQALFYCLPGKAGWDKPLEGRQAKLWNARVKTGDGSFGVKGKRFGFNIVGTADIAVVVEASAGLSDSAWVPVSTNTLAGGLAYFSEPCSTNGASRFYRLRMP